MTAVGVPGIDVPDARGRTGLDRVGRDLTGNPDVVVRDVELLSSSWYVNRRTTFERRGRDSAWRTEQRETHDRGNGATLLPYDTARRTVLLTRQFRFPAYVNGRADGMLVEACAGLLDRDDPEACIRKEAEEETGYRLGRVEKVFEAYMSPGSVTEKLYFFVAEYEPGSKAAAGGGLEADGEEIEVLEVPLIEALAMVQRGEIVDGKTIMLLQHAALSRLLG